jgi:hypothetical protein
MKSTLLSLFFLVAQNVLGQQGPSFQHYCVPFMPTNCEIAWTATTNQIPTALWIYKTVPQHFPDEAISNLVAMGSFTSSDRMTVTDEERAQATPKQRAAAENAVGFHRKNEKRSLTIYPATGYISYSDAEADVRYPIEDVPDEATAQELGLKLFDQFGFPRSDLARKPNSSELLTLKKGVSRSHFDKEQRKTVEDGAASRGVMFDRRIDGVNFAGMGVGGGFSVLFASHAAVAQLELVWRNLKPYKKYSVAAPAQMEQWIKEGKAAVRIRDAKKVNPRAVKKFTITEISPLYMGELGLFPQDFTYPFADLTVLADTGQTNIAIQLYCPILTDKDVNP